MRKTLFVLLLAVALVISASSIAFAGGDKVRGDKGQGEVNQVQVEDPFPFQ
jgi:hypothetical protein